jgi:hypothetical protein
MKNSYAVPSSGKGERRHKLQVDHSETSVCNSETKYFNVTQNHELTPLVLLGGLTAAELVLPGVEGAAELLMVVVTEMVGPHLGTTAWVGPLAIEPKPVHVGVEHLTLENNFA